MNMFGDKTDTMSLSDAIKSSANQMLFRTLLTNPEKRAKVLELLTQEGIVDENSSPNKYSSPIKRLQKNNNLLNKSPKPKNNTLRLESPSALARKRALQRLESSSSDEPSQKLPSPLFVGTPKSYNQILKGVVAYCEIRSNGEDRSAAIKKVIQSMGAIVKDNLCTGVTHVILKDGLYTTYRKAKLLKMHVVSVLWLEAVRKHKFKVPEAKFPAVCADAYDANLTEICKDMQKDYEEVIQDELNKTKEFDDNRRRSEVSITNFVTDRNKWRSTMHGSHFKDPHNRTEIASPYKYINTNPELSESDSYVSVGSDVVPSSQPVAKVLFPDPEPDELLPESNLIKARNSFELEKASKIRSPESILKETCKKSLKKISVDKEDSLKLHVTTTDDSNLNSTEKTRNSSSRNLLEDSSINKKNSSEELNLYISEDSTNISKEIQNNKLSINTKSNSFGSAPSSDSEISKNKTRRRTVGLKRPQKSSTESLATPKRKTNFIECTLSSEDSNIENKPRNVKKNSRRQTLFKINSPIKEIESSVRKTRRKTLANLQNTDESMAEEIDKNTSKNIKSPKKNRRKTVSKPEDKVEEELKKIFGENEDVIENTEPDNNLKKTRRKTLANTPKRPAEISDDNIRKSKRKTIAKNSEETSNSSENFLDTPSDKITIRKSRRNTIAPETTEIQPAEEQKTSTEKSKPRVRRLFDPNQQVSLSQIIGNEQTEIETPEVNVSPPKKVKYKVPLVNLPILLSEKAKKKTRSTVKAVKTKSVPPKIPTQENKKRKSARALTFSSTSSETDLDNDKNKKISTPVRKSERIAKTPKNFKFSSSTDLSSDSSKTPKSPKKSQTSLKSKLSQLDEPKRRSTLDFVPQRSKKSLDESRLTQKQKLPAKLPSIVCTRFHKPDVQVFQQIVKKLGGFVVEDEVSKRTTHLVAGGPARTINLLRAIARGCWILRQEWLFKSLEAGKWLEEEDYEMVEFSPAVQKCRVEKHSFGPLYSMDLFTTCGPVFVSRGSSPRFSDLEELVEICGGQVVRFAKDAKIVVGEQASQEGVTCVSEKWILDSITHNKMKKLKNYVLHTRSSPVL